MSNDYIKHNVELTLPTEAEFDAMSIADKKALGREIARLVGAATGWEVAFVCVDGLDDELLTFQRTRYETYKLYDAENRVLFDRRIVDSRSDAVGAGVAACLYNTSACAYGDLTVKNIALMLARGLTRPTTD